MAYEVVVAATAEREAESIYQWLLREAPGVAADWYNGLFEALLTLEEYPLR